MTDFLVTDVPPDDPPGPIRNDSSDPVCQYPGCDEPLVYAGRGRRPKFCDDHKKASGSASSRAGNGARGDVKAAMETLQFIYDGVAAGLTIVAPTAASVWADKIDGLQAQNAQTLANDKPLCRAINRFGQTSARGTFIASHLIAVAPVAVLTRVELSMRSNRKRPQPPTGPEPVPAEDVIDRAASNGAPPPTDPAAPYNPKIQF